VQVFVGQVAKPARRSPIGAIAVLRTDQQGRSAIAPPVSDRPHKTKNKNDGKNSWAAHSRWLVFSRSLHPDK
jgi:hypothetical protein